MKKTIAMLLVILLGLSTMALAEEIELDKNTISGETMVSLTINIVDSYTVIIPAAVTIDPETHHGSGVLTLKSGYVLGGDAQNLYVRLTGAENRIAGGYIESSAANADIENSHFLNFKLKNENGNICEYAVKASNANYPFSSSKYEHGLNSTGGDWYHACTYYRDFNLISATSTGDNSADKTSTLDFYVATLPTAGTYTDTLTFSIITE